MNDIGTDTGFCAQETTTKKAATTNKQVFFVFIQTHIRHLRDRVKAIVQKNNPKQDTLLSPEIMPQANLLQIHTTSVFFVRTINQLTSTLFQQGGTAAGTFRTQKRGVLFHKGDGTPFAYLCANRPDDPFFVTCHRTANGKIRYMHALSGSDKALLGMVGFTHAQERECALQTWLVANPQPHACT